jgi:hypothetical protein
MLALAALTASVSHGGTDGNATNSAPKAAMAPAPLTYDSFRLITERNIFNGNRSGQRVRSTRSSSQQRSTRVDSFTLVGTLVTDSSVTAFFDGTESSFHKALKPGARIASFELASVQPAGVRLTEGTNMIDLKVGAGFRREERGPWKTTGSASKYVGDTSAASAPEPTQAVASPEASVSPGATTNDEPAAAPATPDSDVEMNDVLKKLMEKRAKE